MSRVLPFLGGVILALMINEFSDVSPWMAKRLIARSARLWAGRDAERAAVLHEEWRALIDECPGRVLKLAHALWFFIGATHKAQSRRLAQTSTRALRVTRTAVARHPLLWPVTSLAIVGWWVLVAQLDVALPEAYTVPFAALALLLGFIETRRDPSLSSWTTYGPALLAAFVPTVGIVLTGRSGGARTMLLFFVALATAFVGICGRVQALVVAGTPAVAVAAINGATMLLGPWLLLLPVAVVPLALAGTSRDQIKRMRSMLNPMS